MSDYERKDDRTLDLIHEMLVKHIDTQKAWNETHDVKAEEWRGKIESRMQPLEDFIRNASFSYKFMIGLAAGIGSVYKIWTLMQEHWK